MTDEKHFWTIDFDPMIRSIRSFAGILERIEPSLLEHEQIVDDCLALTECLRPAGLVIADCTAVGTLQKTIVAEPSQRLLDAATAFAVQLNRHGAKVELESVHGWPILTLARPKSEDAQ